MENAISLAHGGSSVLGQFPYPDGSTDPAQYRGFGQVFRPIIELEPWLRQPQSVSDIGIPLLTKPRSASLFWYLMTEGVENIHQALLDHHYQYDILRSLDDLESYSLVVLADQAARSDAEIERLRDYVAQGGRLLASGYSSLWDEQGRRRDDFGLADLFRRVVPARSRTALRERQTPGTRPLSTGLPHLPCSRTMRLLSR